jgi:hypothetical protein
VDAGRAVADLKIDGESLLLECVVTAFTAGRKSRWIAARKPLDLAAHDAAIDLCLDFDSARLAESLTLTTGIYLTTATTVVRPLSPRRAGSRLWEESMTLALEGTAPRPSMRVHSFSESYRYDGMDKARHYIEIHANDAEEPFRNSVVINLNADLPDYVAAISSGEAGPSRELFEATVRAVLVHALFNDILGSANPAFYEPGTIGRTAADWLGLCFPEEGLDGLRRRCRSEPGEFEAKLQSRLAATLEGAVG